MPFEKPDGVTVYRTVCEGSEWEAVVHALQICLDGTIWDETAEKAVILEAS